MIHSIICLSMSNVQAVLSYDKSLEHNNTGSVNIPLVWGPGHSMELHPLQAQDTGSLLAPLTF